jgi:hypothetical protein
MLEDKGENLDHLAVAARRLEHALLQSAESWRQLSERRAVAQGAGFALDDRETVPPVVNRRESGRRRDDVRRRSAPRRRRRCALDRPSR